MKKRKKARSRSGSLNLNVESSSSINALPSSVKKRKRNVESTEEEPDMKRVRKDTRELRAQLARCQKERDEFKQEAERAVIERDEYKQQAQRAIIKGDRARLIAVGFRQQIVRGGEPRKGMHGASCKLRNKYMECTELVKQIYDLEQSRNKASECISEHDKLNKSCFASLKAFVNS